MEPWRPPEPVTFGACWVCFERGFTGRGAPGDRAWAVALTMRRGKLLATTVMDGVAQGAYQPGLMALREGPLLEDSVRALASSPDLLLVNATGRDHPRRAGLALHLGVVLDLPTVGVTHRPLMAEGRLPGTQLGATSPLAIEGEVVAMWLRTRAGVRPVVVHPAWRTDVETAIEMVRRSLRRARTPEPLRRARRLARLARAGLIPE
ncbi:MAG: endonuclease V, partial [Actinomycetota bacterium]